MKYGRTLERGITKDLSFLFLLILCAIAVYAKGHMAGYKSGHAQGEYDGIILVGEMSGVNMPALEKKIKKGRSQEGK